MKKIKLISAISLAGALVLSGCGHTHTFSEEWLSNDDQHWHPATCGHNVAGDLGNHVDSDHDGLCDVCDRKIGDPVVDPAVSSVSISGSVAKLDLGTTITLTGNVVSVGGASTGLVWSVDDSSVASISATTGKSVVVTPIKEGKVVITATSNFDSTKSAFVEIQVIDRGFDPSWIDQEGYTYSKTFPVDAIKAFVGDGEYDIVEPDSLEGGCYYKAFAAEGGYIAYFEIIVDGIVDEDYASALVDAKFDRVYVNNSDEYEAVDPTGIYTVTSSAFMDSAGGYVAPTYIDFFRSSEAWASSKLTEDVAWDDEKIVNEKEGEKALAREWMSKVPFVALGEEYEIEYVVDDSLYYEYIEYFMYLFEVDEAEAIELMEYFGITKEACTSYYVVAVDYSVCRPFDGYEDVLLNAGYAHIEGEDEDGPYDYFELNDGLLAYDVQFGFGPAGNSIYVMEGVATLSEFPKTEVDAFVSDVIGSKYEVLAYAETEGASFQAQAFEDEFDIVIDYATLAEAQAYADKLADAGFDVTYTPGDEEYYPSWVATKGKIVVEFYLSQVESEEEEGVYLDEGPVYMYIYADDSKHEEKGVYLPETSGAVLLAGSVELVPEVVELEGANFTWASSDETIATVEDGVVTLLAVGEVDITVTSDVETSEAGVYYSASTHLVIAAKPDFAPVLADANALFGEYGATEVLSTENIPEIDCLEYDGDSSYFDYYGCYLIYGLDSTETEASYKAKVESLGFSVEYDEDYEAYIYNTEEFEICFYAVSQEGLDYLTLEVYLGGGSQEGGQIVDESQLYDGAEVCITCLDQDVALGAYNGSKNFSSVALGDTFDGCTVFTLEDNGDGTWGLFDEDGNQYGADSNKNIKISGSGVSYDWTIEFDDLGDAYLSCNGFVIAYNKSASVFKTYAESFIDGNSGFAVQLFFADGTPGGGGGGGGGQTDEAGEEFFKDVLGAYLGYEPVFGVDYDDDDGFFSIVECEDLTDDIDSLYALLSQSFYCTEPAIDEYDTYDFVVYSDDNSYCVDIYSFADASGNVIEFDFYDLSY